MSLSARRAWIEILESKQIDPSVMVALRKESVDRNHTMQVIIIVVDTVALRKESVDRNDFPVVPAELTMLSLSARRAWIEIACPSITRYFFDGRSPQGERG